MMKEFSREKLAETIRNRRKQFGLTQQELAERTGINRSMLCRLEKQDYVPSVEQLSRLADVLGFDPAEMFIESLPEVSSAVESRKVTVYGAGYIGLSIATLLAPHHRVTLVDILPDKVEKVNRRVSPIQDEYIERFFATEKLNLTATMDGEAASGRRNMSSSRRRPTMTRRRISLILPRWKTSSKQFSVLIPRP